jgi:hypothetical protein
MEGKQRWAVESDWHMVTERLFFFTMGCWEGHSEGAMFEVPMRSQLCRSGGKVCQAEGQNLPEDNTDTLRRGKQTQRATKGQALIKPSLSST